MRKIDLFILACLVCLNTIVTYADSLKWVSGRGVSVEGETFLVSIDSTVMAESVNNPIPKDKRVILPDGCGWYLHTKTDGDVKTFGPFMVDNIAPEIYVYYSSGFSYTISDNNLELEKCGYYVGNEPYNGQELYPLEYAQGLIDNRGFLYLYIKAEDKAGNISTKSFTLNTKSAVMFSFDKIGGTVLVSMDDRVDFSRSSYQLVSSIKEYGWVSFRSGTEKIFFPSTGMFKVQLNVKLHNGEEFSIISDEYSIETVDTSGPQIFITPTDTGCKVLLKDLESGIDLDRTRIFSLGQETKLSQSFFSIDYSKPLVELVKIVAYDIAGNQSTNIFLCSRTDNLRKIDIRSSDESFLLFAEGYMPEEDLSKDGLYYRTNKSEMFCDPLYGSLYFYIDGSIKPPEDLYWSLKEMKDISFNVSRDTTLGYYTVNGGKTKYKLQDKNTIPRDMFESETNYISIFIREGKDYIRIDSPYFTGELNFKEEFISRLNFMKRQLEKLQEVNYIEGCKNDTY